MRLLNETRTSPPGGWRYTEPTTGLLFRSPSLAEVVARVKLHRDYRKISPNSPEEISKEVQHQIAERIDPKFSHEEQPSVVAR